MREVDSRALYDLAEPVAIRAAQFIQKCHGSGIVLLVTSTMRDSAVQNRLYQIGRRGKANERVVTNARGGESFHQYGCALDVVPLVHGKPIWNITDPLWIKIGVIGESCGLAWAGRWKGKFREYAHFQYTGGLNLSDLQAGKVIV